MRIAHMIDDLGCGGAENLVANLAAFQGRSGHEVEVICLREIGVNPVGIDMLAGAGVGIVTLGKPPGFHLRTLRRLRDHLRDGKIEVLHTHNHLVHHYGAVAGRWARVPVILNTLHGTASLQSSSFLTRALFWLSCLAGDMLVCVDPKVLEVVRRAYWFPRRKLSAVENGVDLERFLALPPSAPGVVVTFGNIGRLEPVKGHDILLQAFAILRREHPQVHLRVLGDGTQLNELLELAERLSLAGAVKFEGFSPDTPAFLRGIDVYVLSSRSEGLPLTVLESMAAGRPVVATAVGGVTELVNRAACGWLCQPENPEALAAGMREALRAPDPGAIGVRGRELVAKFYSTGRMARDYENLYRALQPA